jgi:hypothetical protein
LQAQNKLSRDDADGEEDDCGRCRRGRLELRERAKSEIPKWAKVVQASGAKVD